MIQLAWRLLDFQPDSARVQWYRARLADGQGGTAKTMIVALAHKRLIALWRKVATGEVPDGFILRPAQCRIVEHGGPTGRHVQGPLRLSSASALLAKRRGRSGLAANRTTLRL